MSCCAGKVVTSQAMDVDQGPLHHDLEESRIRHSSHHLEDGQFQTDFLVPGMHCIACIRKLEKGLGALEGVAKARANLSTRRVSVTWHGDEIEATTIFDTFEKIGFEATVFDLEVARDEQDHEGKRLLTATGVAGFAAANIMLLSVSVWSGATAETAQLFHLISGLIAIPAVMYSGQHFFKSAWKALRVKTLNMDVPISLAVLLALLMSIYESMTGGEEAYFDASVTLLFFLLIGRYLDHSMRVKARGAVTRLSQLAARGAAVFLPGGEVRFAPLSEVRVGDRVLVTAGERIPLDAVVVKGASDVDRSLVTGESEPVLAREGSELEAGTLNLSGPLEMTVVRRSENSFISEVMHMMEAAEQGKARYVRIADRLASIYAPAVHLIAFVAFVGWMIVTGGDWHTSVYIAIALLIVTCPCALGLAVPIVHVVGAGRMFERGIMVKDGAAFEKLNEADTFVFDKTGTLTIGQPEVVSLTGNRDMEKVAALLARQSDHPASRAAAKRFILETGVDCDQLQDVQEVPGFGVKALLNGREVRLGRPGWALEISSSALPAHGNQGNNERAFGLVAAMKGHAPLGISLRDQPRPQAAETIRELITAGFDVEIVSGDHEAAVRETAQMLGIETFTAECKPADKVARITELQDQGKRVCVVGDGINDAPALAAAHVSMAPSSGSDIGKLASDLVFTSEGLDAVLFSQQIAVRTNRLVRQNFGIAIAYNCIAVPLAMAGFVTPLIAAIAMSGSSIVVISNSLRLKLMLRDKGGDVTRANKPQPMPISMEAAE